MYQGNEICMLFRMRIPKVLDKQNLFHRKAKTRISFRQHDRRKNILVGKLTICCETLVPVRIPMGKRNKEHNPVGLLYERLGPSIKIAKRTALFILGKWRMKLKVKQCQRSNCER